MTEPALREPSTEATPTHIRQVAGASLLGSVVEWYDFFLYGTMAALVFNSQFFPSYDPLVGTIDAPIARHPGHDYKFAVMDSGKHAVTHYELLEAFRHASLLEIRLDEGEIGHDEAMARLDQWWKEQGG